MGNETGNNGQQGDRNDQSSDSQNTQKNGTTNKDVAENHSKLDSIDERNSNKTQVEPLVISCQNSNSPDNNNRTAENQPTAGSIDDNKESISNDRLCVSSGDNEPSNGVTTASTKPSFSPQDDSKKTNTTKNSPLCISHDDDDDVCNSASTGGTSHNDKQKPIVSASDEETPDESNPHPSCKFRADKSWLDPQYHDNKKTLIKKPAELSDEMEDPPGPIDEKILDRIQGSMIGMALGDALGAHVEFRPHQYMVDHPVKDLESGGTWGLTKGQFTDDTSMALCLANSLVARRDFVAYDQLVRYKWWYKLGYMSSTGQCFDIGAATSQSLRAFEHRQKQFAEEHDIPLEEMDRLSDPHLLKQFDVNCSDTGVAGNGALMRLAPVPLFFFRNPTAAVKFSGHSGQITHGDTKAYDACRYYSALIVAALRGYTKEQLLDRDFYLKCKPWFGDEPLHPDIQSISKGSYKKDGYDAGIRGKGYIVNALEAALWAFWSDENSFEKGALAAVNLGDDTDTTAAIYGQLAGAFYGYTQLPKHWLEHVYAKTFMEKLSKWITYEGECWQEKHKELTSEEQNGTI